ncbi:MAG: copper homeostasis periplasmic binding protein CopC [Hyphomicrobiales bacterium]|nr:copper homeostasis periplasmic binding protein CopC [Hyphomicrobiales bacterium]MBV9590920.1 copper homeostasis periplasmic binding protein CopC [Hyphomicrobiales bacterium]MBV9975939.1 copper homeostasis periplasmic binding protein CopC [Hyphomicrobiales bacterium]
MKRAMLFAATLLLATGLSSAAMAHAVLVKAVPPVGGTVSASPADIRITFSEGVEPRFSKISVAAADGRAIDTGAAAVDPANPAILIVPLKTALQPGSYKVSWHAVSVDTHSTQGNFSFTVKP